MLKLLRFFKITFKNAEFTFSELPSKKSFLYFINMCLTIVYIIDHFMTMQQLAG